MQDTLNARFAAPLPDYYNRRIIVWMDEEGTFAETIEDMMLDNARMLVMQRDHMFELRRQIETDYADDNLLLYCPLRFEKPEDNWLMDVFLYSETFRADYWSLLFDELNIENNRDLRDYARTVTGFFGSKERRQKLAALRPKYTDARELQTGIFCVLCGLKTFGMVDVTRTVLIADEADSPLKAIEKYCGEGALWDAMKRDYGYTGKRDVTLLASHILASAAMMNSELNIPGLSGSAAYAIPAYGLFVAWLREDRNALLKLCQATEQADYIATKFERLDRTALMKIGVYPIVDRMLLSATLRSFAEDHYSIDDAETLLHARADKPWHDEYAPYYAVVRHITDMRLFYLAHRDGFHYDTAKLTWQTYAGSLYKMDQAYRAFCNAYEDALNCGVMALEDDLKAAQEAVERLYKNWFLTELGDAWTDALSGTTLEAALPIVPRQAQFFDRYIAAADSRVFVIVSDGLRYEVAQELTERLNGKLNGNSSCMAMVGTIPTITPVGMAALLPHRKLRLEDDMRMRCDGLATDAASRDAVLKATVSDSLAVGFDDFRQMNRAQRQELVKGMRVVYIYHDVIDKAGESGSKVFSACETAMNELSQMMRILVNELSAANVYITADHGFIHTQSPMREYEKTDREVVEGEVLEYKRRHAVVRNPRHDRRAVFMPLTTLGRDDLAGVFPRGCMRFRLQGGSGTYMHGGLALQELMVPLIRYQNKKSGQKGFTAITKAEIVLLGDNRKISNNIFTLAFYQKSPCVGKVQARQALARFEDSRGEVISDEHRIIANSAATENNERVTKVTFHLLGSGYDRNTDYWLVLKDAEDGAELSRTAFRIDVVFGLDFDF